MRGTVKMFDEKKGYGFIKPENANSERKRDVFVHHSGIVGQGRFRSLKECQSVEFEITEGRKGLQATNVNNVRVLT